MAVTYLATLGAYALNKTYAAGLLICNLPDSTLQSIVGTMVPANERGLAIGSDERQDNQYARV